MYQAKDSELGTSQDPCASGSSGELGISKPSLPAPTHQHHHNALDDMLNTEVVEADDAAIAREEVRNKGNFDDNIDYSLYTTNSMSEPPSYDQVLGHRLRCHAKLMRARERDTKVTNVELFFDLVFVFAISAISETMEEHLSLVVVLEMLLVTLAVWWAWVFSAWTFNWFNPDSYLVRLLLLSLMLVNLIMSAFIPESFGDQSFLFALMYVIIQVGRTLAAVIALHGHRLQKNYIRVLFWFVASAVLWLVGGAVGGNTRNVLWTVAIILEYISAATGFYTPGIGKSVTSDWDIHGGHLAERCSLFIIIALGESIVVTGESFKTVFREAAGVGMFIVAFVGAAAMWWIYFHTASTEAIEYVEHCSDPGRIGRVGYTYIHVVMVVGIVWSAVADRISIVEPYMVPHEHDEMMPVVMMIGGPVLFVLGHAMFRHTFCKRMPVAHLATIVALVCVTPIGIFLPAWATAIATTTILILLSVYESYFRCYVISNPINPVHK
ncbi:hypothetical protein BGX26_000427 [Mortierella sp. AD094]|nr:hypothetical protein BGX26_000427 [Mortierella sp. AD094]